MVNCIFFNGYLQIAIFDVTKEYEIMDKSPLERDELVKLETDPFSLRRKFQITRTCL